MQRGSVKTKTSTLVSVWLPTWLLEAMDAAVVREDSDRSKFIRRAVRNRITDMVSEPAGRKI